ncbi:hypothetical protein O6H91_04G034900 [Diphasiastrum complanatum]|uniref:Uncharacterized protein n=1 Tax=Diphasiastrum complanatum TaxID=34168 RepID=A0ACC2DW53_DIPCM|nr:hypothetical protein O6H91_04G034900 [Diphasiastrum complanatum]
MGKTNYDIASVVLTSAEWVASRATHVSINTAAIAKVVERMDGEIPTVMWDFEGIHFFDNGPLTAQYLLVLDALNFCFWPDEELQYDHLAEGLKNALLADDTVLDAHRLQSYTGPKLRELLHWPRNLPLEEERARLLREVGAELEKSFGGKASNLVLSAKGSAVALLDLITRHFPGFRDSCVYKGHQIFIYKRAQIFVADLWGAFKGQGLGAFKDIACITMFADYVVPAVLRHWGILEYSPKLANSIDSYQEIAAGTEEEVEIRACTIAAVERLREQFVSRTGKEVLSVQIDWWLWSSGLPRALELELPFHHTLTINY